MTNTPCRGGEASQCTGQVTIFTRGRTIEMAASDGKMVGAYIFPLVTLNHHIINPR